MLLGSPSARNASTGRCGAEGINNPRQQNVAASRCSRWNCRKGGYAASLEPSQHYGVRLFAMTDDGKAWFFKAQIARIRRLLLTTVNDEQTERALKQLAEEYEARASQEERRRAKED
jgi:hypothetical protein